MSSPEGFRIQPEQIGPEENQVADETDKAKTEKRTLIENLRKSNLFRGTVFVLSLDAVGFGLKEANELIFPERSDRDRQIREQFGERGIPPVKVEISLIKGIERAIRTTKEIGNKINNQDVSSEETALVDGIKYSQFKVDNYSGTSTLDGEKIGQILHDTFPKGWLEVRQVIQQDITDDVPEQYGLKEGLKSLASCSQIGESSIIFYQGSRQYRLSFLISDVMAHELGHANDWHSDEQLDYSERQKLLLAIGNRIKSEDRYLSDYVESINNEDKKTENHLKASEYWAEICSQYFTAPEWMNIKDYLLVDGVVRKADPDYQPAEMAQKRWDMIEQAILYKDDVQNNSQ